MTLIVQFLIPLANRLFPTNKEWEKGYVLHTFLTSNVAGGPEPEHNHQLSLLLCLSNDQKKGLGKGYNDSTGVQM